MGYQQAVEKAWGAVSAFPASGTTFTVKLLNDTYTIDLKNRTVTSVSDNIQAKDHISIILLHYLERKLRLKILPLPSGEWIDFKELDGGEGYYPAFKKRTIDKVLKKYGSSSEDKSMIVQALEDIPMMITVSKADEEFGADANILFDRTIQGIFCTEDIVVLTEIVAYSL